MLEHISNNISLYILGLLVICLTIYIIKQNKYIIKQNKKFGLLSLSKEEQNFFIYFKKQLDEIYKNNEKQFLIHEKLLNDNITKTKTNIMIIVNKMNDYMNTSSNEQNLSKNHLKAIEELISRNSEKIRRFEDGYDYKIQKNFVLGIIEVILDIDKKLLINQENQLKELQNDLLFLLEKNQINEIKNELIKDPKFTEIISESTNEANKHNKLLVYKRGFYLQLENGNKKVIKVAKVRNYKYNMKGI